jgi:hypothetical protein
MKAAGVMAVKGTYAYSLDRETFTGVFNTRDEAFRAGCYAAERLHAQLTEVFVGQRVAGDPQADLHAWEIIKSMRDRARAASADDSAGYLAQESNEQVKDLDGAIEAALQRWLANYKLGPGFFRIESVSEHPIPNHTHAGFGKKHDDEVHDVGESDYPLSR